MAMRKRKIKFSLEMKDGEQVRDLEALQEHFDLEKVIGYFQDGKLLEWLRDRFYDDEADAVSELNGEDSDFGMRLCEIFHVESKGIEVESPEAIAWRNERLEQLKQYTADPEILRQVDVVAFNQDDLEEILHEEDTNVVYLCQNSFTFPSGMLRKKNMRYVGIGKNVEVTVKLADSRSLSDLNISFENVTVHEVRVNTTASKDKSAEKADESNSDLNISFENVTVHEVRVNTTASKDESAEKADESKESTSECWKRIDFLSEAIYRLCSKYTPSKFMALRDKPIFLFDDTIKKIDGRRRDFISRLCLQKDETLICIMSLSEGIIFDRKVDVAFSNRAVYTRRTKEFHGFGLNSPDVISSVKYSDIEDVIFLKQIEIKVCKKNGSSDKFPCNRRWGRAIRWFLMLAADKRSILFENNNALYHMKFESLDDKTLGQMLV